MKKMLKKVVDFFSKGNRSTVALIMALVITTTVIVIHHCGVQGMLPVCSTMGLLTISLVVAA